MAPVTSTYRPPHRPNHNGIDYGVPVGTPVYINQPMTVVSRGDGSQRPYTGYGNYITLRDANGNLHMYAHLENVPNLQPGQQLGPDSLIGNTGNTGRSEGPHLHYEVKNPSGEFVDPQSIDPATGKPYTASSGFEKGKTLDSSLGGREPNRKPTQSQPGGSIPQAAPSPNVPGNTRPTGPNPIGQTTEAMNRFFRDFGHVMNPRLGAGDLKSTRVPPLNN